MTTLYKKVGRRYRPVAEHEEWGSYPEGAHLVMCRPVRSMNLFGGTPPGGNDGTCCMEV